MQRPEPRHSIQYTETRPDVLLADLTTLKAHIEFEGASMDAEHSELAKQAAVSFVFALIAPPSGAFPALCRNHAFRGPTHQRNRASNGGWRGWRGNPQDGPPRRHVVAIGMIGGLSPSLAVNRIYNPSWSGCAVESRSDGRRASVVLILVALLACLISVRRPWRHEC